LIKHDPHLIAHRLDAICHARFGGKPTVFAAALEISYENLHQYIAGKAIPGNRLQARLRALGIDPEWVMYGTGRSPLEADKDLAKSLSTPQVMRDKSFAVYDEVPRTADDFDDPVDLYQPWTVEDFSTKAYVFLELTKEMAESMKPVLAPGDLVLIARRYQCSDGDLVAARWDDGPGAIKIFRAVDGKVGLWSINPSIEPLILPKKAVSIHKVVLIRKKHA
jgi:phage repressor protein C with HTH and peptisase S24 domain